MDWSSHSPVPRSSRGYWKHLPASSARPPRTWQQGGSFLKESGSDAVPHLTVWCLEKELLVARRLDTTTATRSLVPACITCGSFQGSCVVLAVHTSQGWRQCVLGTTAIYIARKPSVLFPLGEGGFPPSPATHIPHLRGMNTPWAWCWAHSACLSIYLIFLLG